MELLEQVKKVCSECFKLEREEGFKGSNPVNLLNELVDRDNGPGGGTSQRLDNVDWEDVFVLQDDDEWPSQPPEFKPLN